jgi:Ni,Fe-hydrogenase I large subunit
MLKCEVKVTQDQEMLHSNINQKMQGIDNLLFDMAARVAECQVVKQQFEIFLEKQLKFEKMFNIDYKTEIIT